MWLSIEDVDHLEVFLLWVAPLEISSRSKAIKSCLIWTVALLVCLHIV